MAETLEIAVDKQLNVASMGRDVVNIRGPHSLALSGASPAERFTQQLRGAAFRPVITGIRVQVMPGSGFFALRLWLVIDTIAARNQLPTSWVFAFTQWLQHCKILSDKNKKPEHKHRVSGTRLRLKAQAQWRC